MTFNVGDKVIYASFAGKIKPLCGVVSWVGEDYIEVKYTNRMHVTRHLRHDASLSRAKDANDILKEIL